MEQIIRIEEHVCRLQEVQEDRSLIVLNNGSPTTIQGKHRSPSSIDLTIFSPNVSDIIDWALKEESLGSDHLPIIVSLNSHVQIQFVAGYTFHF